MKTNKWTPLFATNFLGVFNDNLLKNLVSFVAVYWLSSKNETLIVTLAAAMLVIPYILFSGIAGKLAKQYKKTILVKYAKFAEIPIMSIAACGFLFELVSIVMAAIFLMGLQSALYSPAKYALIRDIGGQQGISFGTGTMELLTFAGVLLGTFTAALLADSFSIILVSIIFLFVSILGWIMSLKIQAKESSTISDPTDTLNPVKFYIQSFKKAKQNNSVLFVILGLSVFWLFASMLQLNLLVHCQHTLHYSATLTGIVMSVAAVGIGFGCFVAGIISGSSTKLFLVPIGGIGAAIFTLVLFFTDTSLPVFFVGVFFTAFFSGIFKIPLNSYLQEHVQGRELGVILGFQNLNEFLFILISALLFGLFETILDTTYIFLILSSICLTIVIILSLNIQDIKVFIRGFFKK